MLCGIVFGIERSGLREKVGEREIIAVEAGMKG